MKIEVQKRCAWTNSNLELIAYHDSEWGEPVYDDAKLFECLILESMQAGLNWLTILKKRENYRQALDGFNPQIIAGYDSDKFEELMHNKGIVRHRLKVTSIISNAKAYLSIQKRYGSFSEYIWAFVDGKPIINSWRSAKDLPSSTDISTYMAKELKQEGFKFFGPTTCYAFMQAVGMVNDHTVDCFRFSQV